MRVTLVFLIKGLMLVNSSTPHSSSPQPESLQVPAALVLGKNWHSHNHIFELEALRNTYLIMRHGQSLANFERRWTASPANCITGYGLTELGQTQAKESALEECARGSLCEKTIVISSDYLRAQQTAQVACSVLGVIDFKLDERLRERGCGSLEGRILLSEEDTLILQKIAEDDLANPFSTPFEIESSVAVLDRFTRLVAELEKDFEGQRFLLVCHGDLIRIALAAFERVSPGENTRYGHIRNAEIYNLNERFPRLIKDSGTEPPRPNPDDMSSVAA